MSDTATATIGDNRPPAEEDPLRARLHEQQADLMRRRDELLAASTRVPDAIETEEEAQRAADFVKQITAAIKAAEGRRVAEKEPFLVSSRTVDGFFKGITEPLDRVKPGILQKLTAFQRRKEQEERRRREEEERRAREEQRRREAEAAEAQRKLDEAAEAERLAAAPAEAEDTSRALDRAITTDALARQAEGDVHRAAKEADAKPAELSRTRGGYGGVASLRTFMDFKDFNRATLDIEALREHIPLAALEQAVRAYIKAGGRELRGVTIFENTQTRVV